MEPGRFFASDNSSGAHPAVLRAVAQCSAGHAPAYGYDEHTQRASDALKGVFGSGAEPYLVLNGTAGNVLALKAMTQSFNAVLCPWTSHLYNDECGAAESMTGCKLLPVDSVDGKITPEAAQKRLAGRGDEHNVQPKVLSISQPTELGTVYSMPELRALAEFAKASKLYFHIDGARFANAVAHLGEDPRAMSTDLGVDALTLGGTKNGMLLGEAVLLYNSALVPHFKYIRKQGLQLASKMRFIAAQFNAMLEDGLWLKTAAHANAMALLLAERVRNLDGVRITRPVQTNAVFAQVPPAAVPLIQERFQFYVWDAAASEVRWMTSFDTTEEDVEQFATAIEGGVRQSGGKLP